MLMHEWSKTTVGRVAGVLAGYKALVQRGWCSGLHESQVKDVEQVEGLITELETQRKERDALLAVARAANKLNWNTDDYTTGRQSKVTAALLALPPSLKVEIEEK